MRRLARLVGLIFYVFWSNCIEGARADEGEVTIRSVPVITSSSSDIFPESWRQPAIAATGGELSSESFKRAVTILERAMEKYPEEVLRENLKRVAVLSQLKYRGVTTSGTNSRDVVYLSIGDVRRGFTDGWIERVFHAEFSSILLRKHKRYLDQVAWNKLNPIDFKYLGDGVDAIKQGKHGLRPEESLNATGFLAQYSQSTLENDFNAFAGSLFTGDSSLWKLSEQHPPLSGKVELTISFYQALDAKFTKQYFRALVIDQ